jgi:pyrroline-5-carboxylate reductase
MSSAGFIGGGRVARILLGGWARDEALPGRVLVHDPNQEALESLAATGVSFERVSLRDAAGADIVFLALHPPAIAAALSDLRGSLSSDALLVSLAPKVQLSALAAAAGTSRVARMIPNAPSLIGQGYNPVAYGDGIDAEARAEMTRLFAPWGEAPEVNEHHLEAYAILTGMGPTYFWFQWQALRDVAAELGLAHADADRALRATVNGAVATLLHGGLTPEAVMDLIPVKPLADVEPALQSAYRTLLPALHAKIRPVAAPRATSPHGTGAE